MYSRHSNKSSDFNTGPLYYSIVGTVINNDDNKGSEITTGPLYCNMVGTEKIIIMQAVISILGHYTKCIRHS